MATLLPMTVRAWNRLDYYDDSVSPWQMLAAMLLIFMGFVVDLATLPLRALGWMALLAWCAVSVQRRHLQFGHGRNERLKPDFYLPQYYRCGQCGGVDNYQHWRWKKGSNNE